MLYGCATNPVTGRSELMLLSEQQEIRMGKEAAPAANWDFGGEYRDKELQGYLERIVKRIWSISERPQLPVSFHIQNTSIPNAFALPGYVAITRGLLVELENDAQFAAVMGHEAGHVMARHSASRISYDIFYQAGLSMGGALLGDSKGADSLIALGSIGSSLLLLKYDRSQELESDRLGVIYAAKLGYDPYESITAHRRLEQAAETYLKRAGKTSRSGGFMSEILSTHPRKDVRIEEIRRMIQNLPPYRLTGDGKFSSDFLMITGRIRQVNDAYVIYDDAEQAFDKKNYDEADRIVQKAIHMDSQQATFYALRGRIELAKKYYDSANIYFNKALSLDNSYQPAFYGIGISEYKKNKPGRALEYMKKSLSLYPGHPGSLYVAGLCYHDIDRPEDALANFRKFAGKVKRHPEVYGYLGINYEKLNKTSLAIDAYTVQVRIDPENRMGRYAKQRLAVLKSPVQQ
jgi:predicted Zn-dependent protease